MRDAALLEPQAVLLDPYTGKPGRQPARQVLSERGVPIHLEDNFRRGWRGGKLDTDASPDLGKLPPSIQSLIAEKYGDDGPFARLPEHIQENLLKSGGGYGPFAGMRPPTADRSLYEVLRYWITADPTAITAAAEALMVPAFNFGTSELQVGTCLKYTLIGSHSLAVTTPGTAIMRLRWGGLTGALQVTSGTLAPTGTQVTTNASFVIEYWMTVRSIGAAATLWAQGRWQVPGTLETTPASTTILVAYLKNEMVPPTGAAIGAAFDQTQALGPSPTYQPSVSTASLTTHLAFLECMN
jgi:hypothetical protein